jgi:calcineurin-like phosphoesterase family protein
VIFFTSDTHFLHENIIKLNNRPFKNIEEMHEKLIYNWNTTVSINDEVYILGDLMLNKGKDSSRGKAANEILESLNGSKKLIVGNHDHFLDDKVFNKSLFKWIKDFFTLTYDKYKLVLFHYPILEWPGYFKPNHIHLYGHVHNSIVRDGESSRLNILGPKAYNVGVDVNNYKPISIDDIITKVNNNLKLLSENNVK